MNSGLPDKISCIQMRMDHPPCQGSAVLPLSTAALWVVLWLDTFFLWAGLGGEAGDNKVLLIYSPRNLSVFHHWEQKCWHMAGHHNTSCCTSSPGAITGYGGASESSVGTYSYPVDSRWKEEYILFNSSMLWGCLLFRERKIWDSFIFFFPTLGKGLSLLTLTLDLKR